MLFCKIYSLFVIILFSKLTYGDDIASRLKKRYNDDRMKCVHKGKTYPAYKCSGILIRGVRDIHTKWRFAWSLKPGNRERNSFSVAFLRKDTRFSQFPRGYDSGFIIYPHLKTPSRKNIYSVLCAFPLDAHSDNRLDHGCGRSRSERFGHSRRCDAVGLTSYISWIAYYEILMALNANVVTEQCGFEWKICRTLFFFRSQSK